MSLEIYKDITGYPNYQITSWGRVFNKTKGTYMRPEIHDKGYLRVDLWNNGHRKHVKVHRLVAEAFIDNPENKPQINHIDGNNQNNSISNLEWVTNEENARKAKELRQAK